MPVVEHLEAADEHITLRRAGEISGITPGTLRNQALKDPPRLKTIKLGRDLITTRRWLHDYLTAADARDKGRRRPLPESYVAPE